MKVVILCGGMGTRIRELTESIPKPMVPVGGRPILWHIMKIYSHFGYNEFILCLGYQGNVIKDYFLNYYSRINDVTVDLSAPDNIQYHNSLESENWRVTLADTGLHTMTGARIARIDHYLEQDEEFMLTYGDGVADINIHDLVTCHHSHGKLATVTGVHPIGRFGEMECSEHGEVTSFSEKPQVSVGRINGGFFVLRREFIERYLSVQEDLSLEHGPLTRCADDGELIAFNHDGYWQPMDTYREYQLLNNLWDESTPPWCVWK